MSDRRLLVVGLDAFDPDVAATLRREGRLPGLDRLERQAASFTLEHGIEKYSGLAWEQFSTGLAPEAVDRWSACTFDSATYAVDQPKTRLQPFVKDVGGSTVVFDTPYFDLRHAPDVFGMVSWGSHDPGVSGQSNPAGLAKEIEQRFGTYPGRGFVYGHVWPHADRTSVMAQSMIRAVDIRSDVTHWLLQERFPVWDTAITVISEYHSATEALWHGWDAEHPLHTVPGAAAARDGIVGVYEAADRMLGRLMASFPDARILAFSPHGMGRNLSDPAAMVLVAELLYRHATGRRGLVPSPDWQIDGSAGEEFARFNAWAPAISERVRIQPSRLHVSNAGHDRSAVGWMPAAYYRPAWPEMRAFAVPAYYDARIRVNLKDREAFGMVERDDYDAELGEVERLLSHCRDPRDGKSLGIEFERRPGNPFDRHPSDADLIVRFMRDHYAFDHPWLGRIGPVPCRRTGGHSGGAGIGYYFDGSRSGSVGHFSTLEITALVRALMGDRTATGALVEAMLPERAAA
jgi:predicted AlkP superfamily phosphohydrolase/phosphomutase